MLDLNLIRENPEGVRSALRKRMDDVRFEDLLAWDKRRRELIVEADGLKAERNRVSSEIPRLKKQGADTSSLIQEMKSVADRIKTLDAERMALDAKVRSFLESLPNIPDEDVPGGGKEANQVLRTWREPPEFEFQPRDHVQIATDLGLIDYDRGVKMGGNGFWLYRHWGARLEWALLNYFVGQHLGDGYEFMLPPHILTYACGYTAGQFPKFEQDVFVVDRDEAGRPDHFLLPTSETALVNLFRDEIVPEEDLPLRFFSYSPCYRREAGSYRTGERGMIRGHQFNKIEMFQFTTPEGSAAALEELVAKAERLVQGLELHHRVVRLAARDCSASMAKTFDVEVWMPSMDDYKEVSSISNARDYQARRGNMRLKRRESGRNELMHTLNASGLATSRLLPAICEQHQQPDGSVRVPEVLRRELGTDVLRPL